LVTTRLFDGKIGSKVLVLKKMSKKAPSLQADFEELSRLTEEFESGKVDIEEGLTKFKRGLELARRIKKRLSQIENEIKEIKSEFGDEEELTPQG